MSKQSSFKDEAKVISATFAYEYYCLKMERSRNDITTQKLNRDVEKLINNHLFELEALHNKHKDTK